MWCLRPFAFLFNQFFGEDTQVVVGGYSYPTFDLPKNFLYHSIAPRNYPPNLWSNGLIKLFNEVPDDFFIILYEDYWLCRPADLRGIEVAYEYMRDKNVLRFDLTNDRLYAGGMFDVDHYGCYDIIETPEGTPYQLSMQPGIWNMTLFKQFLKPEIDPWQIELYCPVPKEMRILGMRQFPLRYSNALYKGKLDDAQLKMIPKEFMQSIIDQKMIPDDFPRKTDEK